MSLPRTMLRITMTPTTTKATTQIEGEILAVKGFIRVQTNKKTNIHWRPKNGERENERKKSRKQRRTIWTKKSMLTVKRSRTGRAIAIAIANFQTNINKCLNNKVTLNWFFPEVNFALMDNDWKISQFNDFPVNTVQWCKKCWKELNDAENCLKYHSLTNHLGIDSFELFIQLLRYLFFLHVVF